MGGYCFLNNAAIGGALRAGGCDRVAILDVDYHHGNGTQSIFYRQQTSSSRAFTAIRAPSIPSTSVTPTRPAKDRAMAST